MRTHLFLLSLAACTTLTPIDDKEIPPVDPDGTVDTDVAQDTGTSDTDAPVDSDEPVDTDVDDTDDTDDTDTAVLTGCAICDPVAIPFGGGSGTAADPSLICSVPHLDSLRNHPDDNALVCNDIVLIDATFDPIPVFRGVLDGQNHALIGWELDRPTASDQAFIVSLDGGTLQNLRFEDTRFNVFAGSAIAVRNTEDSSGARISNVHVEGIIQAQNGHIAGVAVGIRNGTAIIDSSFTGTVANIDGGFIGGVIDSCSGQCRKLIANGTLTTESWKAGCVAQSVGPTGLLEGGICRMDMMTLNRSGGIVGVLNGGTVRASYFEGRIHGEHWVAGIVGETWSGHGTVEQCYSSGIITADREHSGVGAAGLIGWNGSSVDVIDSAWDVERGPPVDTVGGIPMTTADMHDPGNPAFLAWTSWTHAAGDYPRLPWE